MSIWEYRDDRPDTGWSDVLARECLYCRTPMHVVLSSEEAAPGGGESCAVNVCPCCGWWTARRRWGASVAVATLTEWGIPTGESEIYSSSTKLAAMGCLRNLDLAGSDLEIAEIRRYLIAKYESRFDVHPRVFEEVVASVFRDSGYDVRTTGYSKDGGIDVVLSRGSEREKGVQVKRYRDRIGVELIRSFAGALIINDCTEGIFVTTSEFTRGARHAAGELAIRGLPIEFVNAQRFWVSASARACRRRRKPWHTSAS